VLFTHARRRSAKRREKWEGKERRERETRAAVARRSVNFEELRDVAVRPSPSRRAPPLNFSPICLPKSFVFQLFLPRFKKRKEKHSDQSVTFVQSHRQGDCVPTPRKEFLSCEFRSSPPSKKEKKSRIYYINIWKFGFVVLKSFLPSLPAKFIFPSLFFGFPLRRFLRLGRHLSA
jgi:hypothetical protein